MDPSRRPALVPASVLDRLLDDEPQIPLEPPGGFLHDLHQHKRAVARDLEALLNTRRPGAVVELLEGCPRARESVLDYGIADLGSLSLLNPDHRLLLREQIRRAIERHEPRLARVRVTLDPPRDASRMLRFRVEAVLLHPHLPPVAFDALLKLSSNACRVRSEPE
jgi:type VI secretion system protein ImpF